MQGISGYKEYDLNLPKNYSFDILKIIGDDYFNVANGFNPRLFEVQGVNFFGDVWELSSASHGTRLRIRIKHFRPSEILYDKKSTEFYRPIKKREIGRIKTPIKPLRDFPFFPDLKKYNPKREEYR